MLLGLSHLTFIVRDLDRMEAILTSVLEARKTYDSGAAGHSLSRERFFDVGGIWVATMEGPPLPARSYNHVAFRISDASYDDRLGRIRMLGLDVREGRARTPGEGRSIYFHDDDNRLFELHAGKLEERLRHYAAGSEAADR